MIVLPALTRETSDWGDDSEYSAALDIVAAPTSPVLVTVDEVALGTAATLLRPSKNRVITHWSRLVVGATRTFLTTTPGVRPAGQLASTGYRGYYDGSIEARERLRL